MTSRLRVWPERLKSWCQSLAALVLEPVLLEMRFVSETIWFNLHSRNSVFTPWVRENISALWYFYDIKYSIKVRWAFGLQPLVTPGRAWPRCCVYHCRNPTERLGRSTWWSWPAVHKDGGVTRFNLKRSIFIWVLNQYKSLFCYSLARKTSGDFWDCLTSDAKLFLAFNINSTSIARTLCGLCSLAASSYFPGLLVGLGFRADTSVADGGRAAVAVIKTSIVN